MATEQTTIYGLRDPRDGRIRYVGKANNPGRRLALHLAPSQMRARTHKNSWLHGLLASGARPELVVLEVVDVDAWAQAEKRWISALRPQLTNGTDGGDGNHNPSKDVRAKISRTLTGRAAANKGKKMSPDRKAAMLAAGVWRGHPSYWRGRRPEAAIAASVRARSGKPSWNKGLPLSGAVRDAIAKDWIVTAPDGSQQHVRNLAAFCKANGLLTPLMNKVAHGHRRHHKGWKVAAA